MPSIIKFFEGLDDPTAQANANTLARAQLAQQKLAADAAKSAAWSQKANQYRDEAKRLEPNSYIGDAYRAMRDTTSQGFSNWANAGKSLLGVKTAEAATQAATQAPKPSSAEAQFRVQNSTTPIAAPKHSPAPTPKTTTPPSDTTMTASEQARRGDYSAPATQSTMTASEANRKSNYSAPTPAPAPTSAPVPQQAEYKDSWMNKKPVAASVAEPVVPIKQQMKAVSAPKSARPSNDELMAKAKQDAAAASAADKKANPQDYDQNGNIIAPSSAPQAPIATRDNPLRSIPKSPDVGQEEQFRVKNSIIDKLKTPGDNEDIMNNIIGKGKSMLGSFSNLAIDR